jgi:hypothetical protein
MSNGLTGKALDIAPAGSPRSRIDQAYRDLIAAFLEAVDRVAANEAAFNRDNLPKRLLDQAEYHTVTRYYSDGLHEELDDQTEFRPETVSRAPYRSPGHTDFVLWHLIRRTADRPDGYRLTPLDAELVARSRQEYVGIGTGTRRKTVADAAAELGLDPISSAHMRRWRIEVLIARLLWPLSRQYPIPDAVLRSMTTEAATPDPGLTPLEG